MTFSDPASVIQRLADIENDMAVRTNAYESAARNWVIAVRDQKKARAVAFLAARKLGETVADANAQADQETILEGSEAEAEYEAMRAVMRTLEARATIGQSILRAQSRA